MSYGDYGWPYAHSTGCQCQMCRRWTWTTPPSVSTGTFTLYDRETCATFAEAVRFATVSLHLATHGKPTIRREGKFWVVRWKPRYYATFNSATG